MADSTSQSEERGFQALKQHVLQHKVDFALWSSRVFTVLFTIAYFIPLFWNPYSIYYKAILCSAATSALRLHQRLPRVSFNIQFLNDLRKEDSAHYLYYAVIFLNVQPVTLVLLPIFFFGILHSASYALTLLDTLGQNSWWGARLLISLVEFQSRNILRLVSFTEIFLMPFSVFLFFFGKGSLILPFFYYQFVCLRYTSVRNPYTRHMFSELRALLMNTASKPGIPQFISKLLIAMVNFTNRLAPIMPMENETAQ